MPQPSPEAGISLCKYHRRFPDDRINCMVEPGSGILWLFKQVHNYSRQNGEMMENHETSPAARRIPRWSARLLARLSQDQPPVVSRPDIAAYLVELGDRRDVDDTIRQLVRLAWLRPSPSQGVWVFIPLGEDNLKDPYVSLRAWKAKSPDAVFALAGEAAAWHLGYLDRRFIGPPRVWIPEGDRLPFGARSRLATVHLGWNRDVTNRVGPSRALLRRRGLDLTQWAGGLAAFGPEALLAQLAIRPSSFQPWADLTDHLQDLVGDCDMAALSDLLATQSPTAHQRAAYLAHIGGAAGLSDAMLDQRGDAPMPHVFLGARGAGVFASRFNVTDRLVAPRLLVAGKA